MHDLIDKWAEALANSPIVHAAGLSMVIAALRVAYDDKESTWTRIGLETLICGLLTVAAGLGSKAMGLSDAWSYFFGGILAFVGIAVFRETVLSIVKSKFEIKGGSDE